MPVKKLGTCLYVPSHTRCVLVGAVKTLNLLLYALSFLALETSISVKAEVEEEEEEEIIIIT